MNAIMYLCPLLIKVSINQELKIFERKYSWLKVDNGYDLDTMKQMQTRIGEIRNLFANDDSLFFKLTELIIEHENLLKFKDHFDNVPQHNKNQFRRNGTVIEAYRNFERFNDFDDARNFNK